MSNARTAISIPANTPAAPRADEPSRLSVLLKCVRNPRLAFARLQTEFVTPDPVFLEQSRWIHGSLPRVPLQQLFPQVGRLDIHLVQAFDRTWGTSVTLDELCCVLAIAKSLQAKNILEIGTWDGNTTVNLAA